MSYDNSSWLTMRGQLAKDAFSGTLISLVFALLILYLSSRDLITSIVSILCIISVMLSLVGIMKLLGWDIGIIECICLIVFVGISVDYVVHIGHQYEHSIEVDRSLKIKSAYRAIAQSILGSAFSSCLSGIFLIVCQADSLNKFGILLLVTILSSVVTALILLPSVLMTVPRKTK
jgi:predicted RND superfamily exporter protein